MCYDGLWPTLWKAVADRLSKLIMVSAGLLSSQKLYEKIMWAFPGSPVVRTRRFHCRGLGSIPGQELRFLKLPAERPKKKKKKSQKNSFPFLLFCVVYYLAQHPCSCVHSLNKCLFIAYWDKPCARNKMLQSLPSAGLYLPNNVSQRNPYSEESIIMIMDAVWGGLVELGGGVEMETQKAGVGREGALPKGD